MSYNNTTEVTFTVISGGGSLYYAELLDGLHSFGHDGFGGGISGRARHSGGAAHHRGTGTLGFVSFEIEYDTDDDLKAIKNKIIEALTTENSGVL